MVKNSLENFKINLQIWVVIVVQNQKTVNSIFLYFQFCMLLLSYITPDFQVTQSYSPINSALTDNFSVPNSDTESFNYSDNSNALAYSYSPKNTYFVTTSNLPILTEEDFYSFITKGESNMSDRVLLAEYSQSLLTDSFRTGVSSVKALERDVALDGAFEIMSYKDEYLKLCFAKYLFEKTLAYIEKNHDVNIKNKESFTYSRNWDTLYLNLLFRIRGVSHEDTFFVMDVCYDHWWFEPDLDFNYKLEKYLRSKGFSGRGFF
jgi:hypothetical protein